MAPEGQTWLYRFWGADDVLLYVGITSDIAARTSQHQADKPWFRLVKDCSLELHDTRTDALFFERQAIINERPLFNLQHGDQRAATAWSKLLSHLGSDTWPIRPQRLTAMYRLTRIEPAFVDIINRLWNLQDCADDFCGDCAWEGRSGPFSGQGERTQVRALFGFDAPNPLARASRTYDLAMAIAYECLPRGICTLHADVGPRDPWYIHRPGLVWAEPDGADLDFEEI